jgi:hypothetical protein
MEAKGKDNWLNVTARRSEAELRPALISRSQIEKSPSRADGISLERETQLRMRFAAFTQEAGQRLELPCQVICTAVHYFHRFYSKCSLKKNSPALMARACLFLASKVEENTRRIRDIVNTTYRMLYPEKEPLQVTEEYWSLKEEVVRAEQLLLRVLGFNLTSRHPHHYVLHYLKELDASEELAILSWSLLNDPEAIACAAIYLAAEVMTFQISRDGEWWDMFGANRPEIEDICDQILNLYDAPDAVLSDKGLDKNTMAARLFSEKALFAETKSFPRASPASLKQPCSASSTPDLKPFTNSKPLVPPVSISASSSGAKRVDAVTAGATNTESKKNEKNAPGALAKQ